MTITKNPIMAALDDDLFDSVEEEELDDTVDNLADNVDDMQEAMEDVDEDDVNIEIDNNIANHYIAECDKCQAVFVSAMVETDPPPEKISGICPVCDKESDQYLKWIVKDVESDESNE